MSKNKFSRIYKVILIIEIILVVLFFVGYIAYEQKVLNDDVEVGNCVVIPEIEITNLTISNSDVPFDLGKPEK